MVPDVEGLTKQAAQRLEAIQQMEELGSGFYLAMHDLEIRGAGEVLGENQSGNMMEVGFQLYNDMLAEAVRSLKAGREPDLLAPLSARRPRSTCTRRRCCPTPTAATCTSGCRSTSGSRARARPSRSTRCSRRSPTASASCRRRAQTLFDVHRLRVLAKPYGVIKIDAGAAADDDQLRAEPAGRCDAHHRAGAEEPPHQARRQRQAAHRARRAPKLRDRAQLVRDVLRSLGAPKHAAKRR